MDEASGAFLSWRLRRRTGNYAASIISIELQLKEQYLSQVTESNAVTTGEGPGASWRCSWFLFCGMFFFSLAAQQLSHPYLSRPLSVSRAAAVSLAVEPQSFSSLREVVNSKPKKKKGTYS
ncbi:hypothetical protein JHK85_040935 [Glycine max]|nr:hypothetical protein JHK85_040935 [Glycine max]